MDQSIFILLKMEIQAYYLGERNFKEQALMRCVLNITVSYHRTLVPEKDSIKNGMLITKHAAKTKL